MNAPSYLRYANQGATRNLPLDPRLVSSLSFLGDLGVTAEVFSGGQPAKGSGGKRVGSVRHDHGNAGDFRFYKDGRQLDWSRAEDLPTFQEIVRRGKAAGISGFGAGPGYMGAGTMHVGFGSPGTWGAGGRGANAPDWLREAYGDAPVPSPGPSLRSVVAEQEGGGGSPSLAGNAASDTLPPTGAPSMAGPTVNIGLKPERSTELYDVMLKEAMASGARSRNGWDALGSLAQVWAASSEKKEAEAENASELQRAVAAAELDPEFAMVAQLAGGRDGAAQAILGQQQARTATATRAEARADRQATQDYERSQDALANERAERQIAIQEEAARSGRVPAGYRVTEAGLEPIPGGPADPAVVGAGGGDLGLNPQYGVDANGNPVLLQLGKDGQVVQSAMPEGVTLSKEPIRLDAGTHFVLLDPITRQPIGQIPKENRQEAAETAAGTVEGRTQAEREASATGDAQSAQNALDLIESIRDDPYRARGTGVTSLFNRVPGTGGFDFNRKVEQAKSGAFMTAIQQLRGMGALSNAEGQTATAAVTRLDAAMSEEGFLEALNDYERIVRQGLARAQGNMPAPAAPAIPKGPMPLPQAGDAPAGVDPDDWRFMSDEDKALFR